MEDRTLNGQSLSALPRKTRRALIESGVWLRVGFIAASGLIIGLAQLVNGDGRPASALMLTLGGAALAAASWWRMRNLLGFTGDESAVAMGISSGGAAARVGTRMDSGMGRAIGAALRTPVRT